MVVDLCSASKTRHDTMKGDRHHIMSVIGTHQHRCETDQVVSVRGPKRVLVKLAARCLVGDACRHTHYDVTDPDCCAHR